MKLDRIAQALVIVLALAGTSGCSSTQSGRRDAAAVSSTTLTSAEAQEQERARGVKPKVGKVQRATPSASGAAEDASQTLRAPKDEAPRSRDGDRRDGSQGFGSGK